MAAPHYHIPAELHYEKTHHMWARPDGGRVTIGIDELGLEALGDLAYVSLKPVGTAVRRGESIGALEAAKMTSDIISPVSGIVAARNDAVLADPTLVNKACYGDGWLLAVDATDWDDDATGMVSGDALPGWVASEIERYRTQGWIE